MHCPKCGEINREDAKFCLVCGTNLKDISGRAISDEEKTSKGFPPPPPPSQVQENKKNNVVRKTAKHVKLKIALVSFIIFVVIFFILYIAGIRLFDF